MPVPENLDPGPSPGLFSNLRSFWGVLVAILYTRLDLATTELEESGTHAVRLIVVTLAAVLVIVMTFFFLFFFLIVVFWKEADVILGIVTIICVLSSTALVLVARHLILERPKFLAQTLAELRRDAESLRPTPVAPKPSEVKP
ncbi:MAG: phage holin family protein [Methylacidiphilales bacterium]|nr:phage holin family protein [Candidatus Methylacidiphilales bacterium]